MYKFFTFLTFFCGLSLGGGAYARPNKCLLGLIEAKQWNDISLQQAECMQNHDEAKKGLAGLCTQDLKDFSPMYKTYRGYEVAYQETFSAIQSATDSATKQKLQARLVQLNKDWLILGYKQDVSLLLSPVWHAKTDCQGQ